MLSVSFAATANTIFSDVGIVPAGVAVRSVDGEALSIVGVGVAVT